MYARHAYEQPQAPAMPRIDVILTLYDYVLQALDRAERLASAQSGETDQLLHRAQVIIGAIAAGIDPNNQDAARLLPLYEYLLHCMREPSPPSLRSAHEVLQTLRDGFKEVRGRAIELERGGQIPPLHAPVNFQAMA